MNPRYMLDTDICIYISKQKPSGVKARFDRLKPGQTIMSVITYGELYYGASKSSQKAKALAHLAGMVQDIPSIRADLQLHATLRPDIERLSE